MLVVTVGLGRLGGEVIVTWGNMINLGEPSATATREPTSQSCRPYCFAERCHASLSWRQIVFVRSTSGPACPMSRHRRRTGVEDIFCGFAVDGVQPATTLQQSLQWGWVKGAADWIQGWYDSQEAMSHQRASQNTNYSGLMQLYSLLTQSHTKRIPRAHGHRTAIVDHLMSNLWAKLLVLGWISFQCAATVWQATCQTNGAHVSLMLEFPRHILD